MIKDKEIYSDEELELFEALEEKVDSSEYKPMPAQKLKEAKQKYKAVAKNTIKKLTKKKSLNLRVYEEDIPRIKAIALQKGIPYQTLLSSIIHQVATKEIEIL